MNKKRSQLIHLLNTQYKIDVEKVQFVVQNFSDFKVDVFWHLCTLSFVDFQKWLRDTLVLQEGEIEALERRYKTLFNQRKESLDRQEDLFF